MPSPVTLDTGRIGTLAKSGFGQQSLDLNRTQAAHVLVG